MYAFDISIIYSSQIWDLHRHYLKPTQISFQDVLESEGLVNPGITPQNGARTLLSCLPKSGLAPGAISPGGPPGEPAVPAALPAARAALQGQGWGGSSMFMHSLCLCLQGKTLVSLMTSSDMFETGHGE